MSSSKESQPLSPNERRHSVNEANRSCRTALCADVPDSALYSALDSSSWDVARRLLGCDRKERLLNYAWHGRNVLHCAGENDAPLDIVGALVAACPDDALLAQALDTDYFTPLTMALFHGASDETVLAILAACPAAASMGPTQPIHYALYRPYPVRVVKALLDSSGDRCPVREYSRDTPLHTALKHGATDEVVLALIGECPDAALMRNSSNRTPLHEAVRRKRSPGAIEALLTANPEPTLLSRETCLGASPLHFAIDNRMSDGAIEAMLRECPAAASRRDAMGRCPLHAAVRAGCSERIVRALSEAAPCARAMRDDGGRTPLHSAVALGLPEPIIRILLEDSGVACLAQDDEGETPLSLAYKNGGASADVAALILDSFPEAAAFHARLGRKRFVEAIVSGTDDFLSGLLSSCPRAASMTDTSGEPMLLVALKVGASDDVLLMLIGAIPGAALKMNDLQDRALYEAVRQNRSPRVIEALLTANPHDTYHLGASLLHFSVKGHLPFSAIEVILRVCPETTSHRDWMGRTPLHDSILAGCSQNVVDALLKVSINARAVRDNRRRTPLHWAVARKCSSGVVRALLEDSGSACLWQDREGETPLSLAYKNGGGEIAALILSFCPEAEAFHEKLGRKPFFEAVASETDEVLLDLFHLCPLAASIRERSHSVLTHAMYHQRSPDVIKAVLNSNPSVMYVAKKSLSPLQWFVDRWSNSMRSCVFKNNADEELCTYLVEIGSALLRASIKGAVPKPWQALHASIKEESFGLFVGRFFLMMLPQQVREADSEGNLPLHLLCESTKKFDWPFLLDVFKAYPEAVSVQNRNGLAPLQIAASRLAVGDGGLDLFRDDLTSINVVFQLLLWNPSALKVGMSSNDSATTNDGDSNDQYKFANTDSDASKVLLVL